jgi:15-cis-phytoene synthase
METAIISHRVGSAQHRAISDDSLKDEDNAAWVATLDSESRSAWLDRIKWIRLADRLAESDLLAAGQSEFSQFWQTWQTLHHTGQIPVDAAYPDILRQMQEQWVGPSVNAVATLNRQAWDRYLTALNRYHQKNLVIDRLSHHTQMLEELAGSFFQVLPDLSAAHWPAVYYFGAVDQFYNNLRDLREDAEQGICYLPTEVLDRFGVTRQAMLDCSAVTNPGYRPMMQFWVEDYRSQLYQRAGRFIRMPDLHPAWAILRAWSLNRYQRIERVLRQCDYDYGQFPQDYWPVVQQELFPPADARLLGLTGVRQMITQSQSGPELASLEARLARFSVTLRAPLDELEPGIYAANSAISPGDRDCRYGAPVSA